MKLKGFERASIAFTKAAMSLFIGLHFASKWHHEETTLHNNKLFTCGANIAAG